MQTGDDLETQEISVGDELGVQRSPRRQLGYVLDGLGPVLEVENRLHQLCMRRWKGFADPSGGKSLGGPRPNLIALMRVKSSAQTGVTGYRQRPLAWETFNMRKNRGRSSARLKNGAKSSAC